MSPSGLERKEALRRGVVDGAGTVAPEAGADGERPGANGFLTGVSGAPLWARWLAVALGACVLQAMDVASTLGTARAAGAPLSTERAVVDGVTSIVVIIAAYPALRALLGWAAPFDGRWLRALGANLAGAAAFAMAHVVGYEALRWAIYPVIGETFRLPPPGWIPGAAARETGAYLLIAAMVWFVMWAERRTLAVGGSADGPETFDIRDGGRVIRAPVAEILAVQAADNYVEFNLADGRRPLMRATLGAIAAALGPHGFVRTHRAWLVNRRHVRELAPAGSGDGTLTLSGGLVVPLSRRLRGAMTQPSRRAAATPPAPSRQTPFSE